MKFKKNILLIIGAILVIAQIISFIGLARGRGLYPSGGFGYYRMEPGISIDKLLYAIDAGCDRFLGSLGDAFTSGNEWKPPSSAQMTSGEIRESLRGGGLFWYDAILTCTYTFVGIAGAILLVIGKKIKRKFEDGAYQENTSGTSCTDDPSTPSWERFL